MQNQEKITSSVKVKEIFKSIQGEGPYVGFSQLFIRFCKCNLNCAYCDTDFNGEMEFSPQKLREYIEDKINLVHSISLTGGEPLLFADFLKEFLPLVEKPVYLETNATLAKELSKIIDLVDIISADIKLPSATGINGLWNNHDVFFKTARECASRPEMFAKIVFNDKITDDEIQNCVDLAKKYDLELILQPQTLNDKNVVKSDFAVLVLNKFLKLYNKTRLIPQVHKYFGVE